jgi:lipoic acid synthetase/lipoate-protein ligase A
MEEYAARTISEDDYFFMWQVRPTVIFGRNQNIENEVNIDYCKKHDIQMYRRKSGGGCVYADEQNVMLSLVTRSENVNLAFNQFVNMVLLVLNKMGIEAAGTTHNDIMIGDKKVSGTACYHLAGRSIVHSTLLYDTNMEHMLNAITPSTEKLQSKGIQSVRQRITLLKDHTTMSLDEVKQLIRDTLCSSSCMLTPTDINAIESIEQEYLQKEFIYRI